MNYNIFVALALLINCMVPAMAVSYSLQHAFCTEYYSNSNNYYENQKSYQYCMQNADSLIQTYESDEMRKKLMNRQYQEQQKQKKFMEEELMRESFIDMPY